MAHPEGGSAEAIALVNPASSRAQRCGKIMKRLRNKAGLNFTVVETSRDGNQTRADLLAAIKNFREPSVQIWCLGGDDTTAKAVQTTLEREIVAIPLEKRPVIVPGFCGQSNDLANMVIDPKLAGKPEQIYWQGRRRPLRPLYCTLIYGNESSALIGTANASFGTTAWTAELVNQKWYRAIRPFFPELGGTSPLEFAVAGVAVANSNVFDYQQAGHNGRTRELAFSIGPRIGKHNKVFPVDIFGTAVAEYEMPDVGLFSRVKILGRLAMNKTLEVVEISDGQTAKITFESETWGQMDGNAFPVPAGTVAEISRSPLEYNVLSTKL